MERVGRRVVLSLILILAVTVPNAVLSADTVARTGPTSEGEFPPGFLFGTGSSPYQVEGGLHATDWYQWEGICSNCSAEKADDGPAFWDKYRQDLARARALLNNAVRIGIDWSRVFPTEASFPDAPDAVAVAHYHQIIRLARLLGLNVMVTVQHFDLPTWVQDLTSLTERRGWEDPAIVQQFATWAGWLAKEFGSEIDWWITINEPVVAASGGWITGVMPPGKLFDVAGAVTAVWNMVDAHAAAYDAIKANDRIDADHDGVPAMISIAHQMRAFYPVNSVDPAAGAATTVTQYLFNQLFLDAVVYGLEDRDFDGRFDGPSDRLFDRRIAGRLDYIGLNYYAPAIVVPLPTMEFYPVIGLPVQSDLDLLGFTAPKTEVGWAIYPEGLREVIDQARGYSLPIVITENGIADSTDEQRPRFIADHLLVVTRAIEDGIDIRGYFHWSLTDNFEWASGYCPRFGLYHVDYASPSKTRTPGAGAIAYRDIIAANGVPQDLFDRYPIYPAAANDCPRQP